MHYGILLVFLFAIPAVVAGEPGPATRPAFANPVFEGADPWITREAGTYYYCRAEGDQAISVWRSDRLTVPAMRRLVWRCPDRGWNRGELWAPELHRISGKWYIYYAASDGRNENHRVGVLEAVTDDAQGSYRDLGQLYTGDDVAGSTRNRWAIDATPVRIRDRLYLVWSGWPDTRDIQYLYIAPMANPWTVAGSRVKLCENDTYAWERVGESTGQRGLHEAPQVLRRRGRLFVVYSCSGSWEPTYKLGMLSLDESDDPLRPENWHKRETPVFAPTEQTFGVGHCCFTRSPDDAEDWTVFHAKMSREHGWQRAVFMQPFRWVDGVPEFGRPVAPGLALPLPAGEAAPRSGSSFLDRFAGGNWDGWRYYGYGRYVSVDDGMLSLGGRPRWGLVNDFRSGEKVLVDGLEWSDLRVTVRLRFAGGRRDAGVLFRVRRPAVGYDAQQGYFAGLIPETGQVVLGRTDGARWTTLAIRSHPFDAAAWHTLSVEAVGPRLRVLVDGREALQAEDREYARGMAGLRVVDTHACFDDFQVEPR